MELTFLDNFLWAASFVGDVVLFIVLLWRRRWRNFPVITGYMFFQIASTAILFVIYKYGTTRLYGWGYWAFAFLDFVFQLSLMFEIARVVLKPTGTWIHDAKWIFMTLGTIGVAAAIILALIVKPPTSNFPAQLAIRGEFFTSMLICELFLMVMIASNHLGLLWRNHVMGLGQGLSMWALVALIVDGAHCLAPFRYYTSLEHVRMFSYLAALVYWTTTFWREEPKRRELTPEMQAYLASIHRTVQHDLSKVVINQHRQ
jgi:hypothetical protein